MRCERFVSLMEYRIKYKLEIKLHQIINETIKQTGAELIVKC